MEAIKEHTYQIGEVARKYHLSVATLRYYDQEGLIPGLSKSASGVRQFTDENLGDLDVVECLKNAGMSIKDIKVFMELASQGDATLAERQAMFYDLKQRLQAKLATLEETMKMVDFKCAYYTQAVADGTERYVKEAMHRVD